MRIGTLDRLIEIHKYIKPQSSFEEPTFVFQQKVWMAKKNTRADEKFDTSQRYADVLVRFTTYPIDGLTILDRVKDEQGRWYDVKAITEIGFNEAVEIDARLISP